MRARDFCVAVKRLARLLSTIRQYNVRDTPGAVFAGAMSGREGREGDQAAGVRERAGEGGGERRRRRGGFRADTEISPILEGWLATPQFARLSSCGLDSTTARDFHPCLPRRRITTPSPPLSFSPFLSPFLSL